MVKPKKHLGQHFLKDQNIARKIVGSLSSETNSLLEIGPGTGVLTQILIEEDFPNYFVIEIDKESIAYLQNQFPGFSENIIQGDFLKFNPTEHFTETFSIIGNFP